MTYLTPSTSLPFGFLSLLTRLAQPLLRNIRLRIERHRQAVEMQTLLDMDPRILDDFGVPPPAEDRYPGFITQCHPLGLAANHLLRVGRRRS